MKQCRKTTVNNTISVLIYKLPTITIEASEASESEFFMSKILNVIIDSNKIYVCYETGKSKMYLADNLPQTVKNYLSSNNAKINYATKTAEQETAEEATASAILETTEAIEAIAEQAETAEKAEEQRRKTEEVEAEASDRVEAEQAEEVKHKIFIMLNIVLIHNTILQYYSQYTIIIKEISLHQVNGNYFIHNI